MPNSAPQILAEAVEAVAKTRWERSRRGDSAVPRWSEAGEVRQRSPLSRAGDDLEAAYPHLLAAFKERLLPAFDRIGGLPDASESIEDFAERVEVGDAMRIAFDLAAALASIDSDGGTPP